MRKFYGLLLVAAIAFVSCQDSESTPEEVLNLDEGPEIVGTSMARSESQCFSMEVLQQNIEKDPSLLARMNNIEDQTQKYIEEGNFRRLVNGSIQIPVVFHVIYRTSSENLPLSVLQAQIDALNEDFNLQNPGRNTIPSEFALVEANVGISFVIEQVIRVQNTKKRSWRPDDSMKFSSSGGSNVVNPQEFLNVWIVNSMPYRGGQILGYAQFPGGSLSTDGVVLGANFVGGTDRTATHEVGHWLNLRHIWGDGGCGVDDFVADTPLSDGPSRGCPSYPTVSCGTNDMTMNFMDYSSDSCLNMFTVGQKQRMDAVFAPGGFRATMAD